MKFAWLTVENGNKDGFGVKIFFGVENYNWTDINHFQDREENMYRSAMTRG